MRTRSGEAPSLLSFLFWKGIRWAFNDDSKRLFLYFSVAWAVMLQALELTQMYINPIYPAPLLRDKPWDWFNPWATWCPALNAGTTDFSHDYCFGTNVAHFGGPYSIMWYWSMYAIALGGRFYPIVNNLTGMVAINMIFIAGIRRRYPGYGWASMTNVMYSWIALLFMAAWPQILFSLFFTTASLFPKRWWIRSILLGMAIAYRIPIGAPIYIWDFIWRYSLHNPWNYIPYGLTASMWLFAFASMLRDHFHGRWLSRLPTMISIGACLIVAGSLTSLWTFYSFEFGANGGELMIAPDYLARIAYGISLVGGLAAATWIYYRIHPERRIRR